MAHTSTKLVVKDSYDDDDNSDDVDDEVFIRDGRNGFKGDDERGLKRPLMAPRRKAKGGQADVCRKTSCSSICTPGRVMLVFAVCTLLALIAIGVILIQSFPFPLERIRIWTVGPPPKPKRIIPCTEISAEELWVKSFPKLVSESPMELVDINSDNVEDVIIGFGTGADDMDVPEVSCDKYFDSTMSAPCMGGVLALNGIDGKTLWQHWTWRAVLYIDCSIDITGDKVYDCIISGKGGILALLNGKSGDVVWELQRPVIDASINVYTAQFISDVDNDGIPDVLAAHTSNTAEQPTKFQGHLMIFSGKDKREISTVETPNGESIFDAPQILVLPDGTDLLVFTTGDVALPGNTYCVPLYKLLKGDISKPMILSEKGNSVSPVLVDLNNDGTEDIVTASGDYISAYDGRTFLQLWNTSVPSTESDLLQTYISPTPAYFNDDLVPDILVTQLEGPGILNIYDTKITVLDGTNGKNLLDKPIIGSGTVDAPATAVSFSGVGNDFFLFWNAVCVGHESDQTPFTKYAGDINFSQQARTNFCHLRFNSTADMRLYVLSQHLEPPGILLYSSETKWDVEHNNSEVVEPTQTFLQSKSQYLPTTKFRQKSPSQQLFHHHNKNRYHYPQQQDLSKFEKSQMNYPYQNYPVLPERNLWPQPDPLYNEDIAFPQSSINSRREYMQQGNRDPMINTNSGENSQDYDSYNDDEGMPNFSTSERDERASFQNLQRAAERENRPTQNIRQHQLNTHKVLKRSPSHKHHSVPRVVSAGTLAKSLKNDGLDFIFATHWLPSSEKVILLKPEDMQCIEKKIETGSRDKFSDETDEELRNTATIECLREKYFQITDPNSNSVSINGGQMTVYRMKLRCECTQIQPQTETCSKPLQFQSQSWPSWGGNDYYKPRRFQ
ncbi:uncharacterized protein LOC111058737 [Nilaparvata lugens]|uniref:uncharacterized protein LOC111058737 n=1 Tax=Nilaparvata lugens TaxID=108931 RepID=UPI00193D3B3C|nr:uncharacterized protein LOC111058737 [Nilaparvata lugens]